MLSLRFHVALSPAAFLLCHGWEGGLAETGKADFAESPAASSASNGVLGERAAFTAGRRK